MAPTPTEAVEALLATPLFERVDRKLLEAVRKEAAIGAGTFEWQPGVARRDGFVRFSTLETGDVVVAQGDLTTELVVVLGGAVEALCAHRGQVHHHRTHRTGEWFGEVSAHSHHPALASHRATEPTRVARLEARLFAKLYAEDDEFRTRIDASYLDNLGLHLRASSLCRDLDEAAIDELCRAASLATVEEGDVVARAGEPADTVHLVRAGAVACSVQSGGKERVLAFYKGNATFGEHVVTTPDAKWPADYVALMRTALVQLPRRAFENLDNTSQTGLMRAANRLVGTDDVATLDAAPSASAPRTMLDELFVMVERESVKGGRALVIDRNSCVRCNMCVESCVSVHDDGVPRLSKVGTSVAVDQMLVTACYHCETPQCMLSCDYAAIRRDPQGRIRFEYDNCVGCAGCIDGCPYGVIRLVEPAPKSAPPPSFLERLPLVGRLFAAASVEPAAATAAGAAEKPRSAGVGGKLNPVSGKTIKCDLCAGLPFEACVYNCPTSAITRREPQSLFDRKASR